MTPTRCNRYWDDPETAHVYTQKPPAPARAGQHFQRGMPGLLHQVLSARTRVRVYASVRVARNWPSMSFILDDRCLARLLVRAWSS
jgi:hypothetical protein